MDKGKWLIDVVLLISAMQGVVRDFLRTVGRVVGRFLGASTNPVYIYKEKKKADYTKFVLCRDT